MIISNARDRSIEYTSSNVPQLGEVLEGWMFKMIFSMVTATMINHRSYEEKKNIAFIGTWQPLSNNDLRMKPEEERMFKWFNCHTKTDLKLKANDLIVYKGVQYRVQTEGLYSDYGYYNYHLVEDFTGTGPYEATT